MARKKEAELSEWREIDGTLMESQEAIRAFNDWFDMGFTRSFERLLEQYTQHPDPSQVPTNSMKQLKEWHDEYHWRARAAEREAQTAEMSDALVVSDRVKRKREAIDRSDEWLVFIDNYAMAVRYAFEEAIAEDDPDLNIKELLKHYPKILKMGLDLMAMQRSLIGDDVQRHHVTIEKLVETVPPEQRAMFRELLMDEMNVPTGMDGS